MDENVHGGTTMDGYVKLAGIGKNQLLLNDNIIPGDKQLNRRQAKCLYVIQRCLELKAYHSHVRETGFVFYICEVLRVSMVHCKRMTPLRFYAHLLVLVTQILRLIVPNKAMLRERVCIV